MTLLLGMPALGEVSFNQGVRPILSEERVGVPVGFPLVEVGEDLVAVPGVAFGRGAEAFLGDATDGVELLAGMW